MKPVFRWRDGYRPQTPDLDPEVVNNELERIKKNHGGELTARQVLEAARKVKSPLHAGFDWNDATAAESHRLEQAGHLIRAVVVIHRIDDEPLPETRAFVFVRREHHEPQYESVLTVLDDAELRKQVLARALNEVIRWQAKYQHLRELALIFDAVAATEQSVAA